MAKVGKVKKKCVWCKKEFESYKTAIRKYCSLQCSLLDSKRRITKKEGQKSKCGKYVKVWVPRHPFADKYGYVMEHRLIVEKEIGRYLKPEEVVHHRNKKGNDNRPDNLKLFSTHSIHMHKEQKQDILIIIQARTGNTRLPGKIFKKIKGQTIIDMVINKAKAIELLLPDIIDEIVIATTNSKEDDIIEKKCEERCVQCYRGETEDVLSRMYNAAKQYNAKRILRLTSDCPFLNPQIIASMIIKGIEENRDYIALGVEGGKWPDGFDAELMAFDLLKTAYKYTPKEDREHVTLGIRRLLKAKENCDIGFAEGTFKGIKLSIDTKEDLERGREYAKFL